MARRLYIVSAYRPDLMDELVMNLGLSADTQVFIDSEAAGRAYMSVEVATPDPHGGQPTIDRQDTSVRLEKRDGQWLITNVESKGPPPLR